VQYEFMTPEAPVILGDLDLKHVRTCRLGELLPDGFTPRKLRQGQKAAPAGPIGERPRAQTRPNRIKTRK
jgi:hypothetical protein